MMLIELQRHLYETGRYAGALDGISGRLTESGVLLAMSDGPDNLATEDDFEAAAFANKLQVAAIKAIWKTESNGAPFFNGKPPILPEPHRFSRNTAHKFDKAAPDISYPSWGTIPYPKTQDLRYDVILRWISLLSKADMPIDAAFASASWGAPQIMGENFKATGFENPYVMAETFARDEKSQLAGFMNFVRGAGILPFLRKMNAKDPASADPVALRYNGTGFRKNNYGGKLFTAFVSFGGR